MVCPSRIQENHQMSWRRTTCPIIPREKSNTMATRQQEKSVVEEEEEQKLTGNSDKYNKCRKYISEKFPENQNETQSRNQKPRTYFLQIILLQFLSIWLNMGLTMMSYLYDKYCTSIWPYIHHYYPHSHQYHSLDYNATHWPLKCIIKILKNFTKLKVKFYLKSSKMEVTRVTKPFRRHCNSVAIPHRMEIAYNIANHIFKEFKHNLSLSVNIHLRHILGIRPIRLITLNKLITHSGKQEEEGENAKVKEIPKNHHHMQINIEMDRNNGPLICQPSEIVQRTNIELAMRNGMKHQISQSRWSTIYTELKLRSPKEITNANQCQIISFNGDLQYSSKQFYEVFSRKLAIHKIICCQIMVGNHQTTNKGAKYSKIIAKYQPLKMIQRTNIELARRNSMKTQISQSIWSIIYLELKLRSQKEITNAKQSQIISLNRDFQHGNKQFCKVSSRMLANQKIIYCQLMGANHQTTNKGAKFSKMIPNELTSNGISWSLNKNLATLYLTTLPQDSITWRHLSSNYGYLQYISNEVSNILLEFNALSIFELPSSTKRCECLQFLLENQLNHGSLICKAAEKSKFILATLFIVQDCIAIYTTISYCANLYTTTKRMSKSFPECPIIELPNRRINVGPVVNVSENYVYRSLLLHGKSPGQTLGKYKNCYHKEMFSI
ncbi:uncharacterized protein LOC142224510 [Haematobia irritans]|uniref:uncharacterized protein LOC142224510 n=1 Tax=Haematobia irritans TaxID=7368 RepID=UPI003F50CD4D